MVTNIKLIKKVENWSNFDTVKNLTGLTDKQISLREKKTQELCALEKEKFKDGRNGFTQLGRNALWCAIRNLTKNS